MVGTSEAWCARSARRRPRCVASRVPALDGLRSGSCAANQWRDSARSIGIFRRAGLAGRPERNFFGGEESSDRGACRSSRGRRGSTRSGSGTRDANRCACRKPLCHMAFRGSVKFPRARCAHIGRKHRRTWRARRRPHGDCGGGFRRPQFVKRSRCFSHCTVVIGVQCMSIRDCTVPKSPSLMARRAVWRREPNRRPSPRRRRLRRRPSAKPRAGRSSLRRVHAIGLQVASRGVASVGGLPCQHAQRCCGTRRQSRRRRASATAGALGSRRRRFSYRSSIKPDLPLGRCAPYRTSSILFAFAGWPRAVTAPLVAFFLDRPRVRERP